MTGLQELLPVAERAVDDAVDWLLTASGEWTERRFKASGEEVTDSDTEVEARVSRVLAALSPTVPVIGEESAPPHGQLPDRCWLLDPIDGTMNFARGSPLYAVSLAYVEDGVPLLGVVHAPALGRRWTTDPTARVRAAEAAGPEDLRHAVVGVSGTGSGAVPARRFLGRLQGEAYRLRMQGSMALDLVGVAEGWFDACVCIAPKPWDVAAGVALCRDRGRTVVGAAGNTFGFDSPVLVAGTPGLVQALVNRWEES
ncbi:inositol monophosphatase family protein [Streptomyces kebangsaanensis]|uniref:inositol monophosphatase family protein n=1 Tax=Streptomyces kebangsaanensis TaxID=864058 RepID=UPI00093E8AEF|nr:inositol monophosphatase [Streptomyces kebangsaanensis]